MTDTEKKAYALGIIAREFNVDFDNVSQEQLTQMNSVAEDAILDEPTSEVGKDMKKLIDEERANSESEYNKGFTFHKDLNENRINPATVFIFELLAKHASKLTNNDKDVDGEILSELIVKFNELGLPVGYTTNPFKMVMAQVSKLNAAVEGQVSHREDEIKALSIGVKHPKYGTLSPHLASFTQLDEAIKKLRDTFNFTEEDYRSK